MQCKYCGAELSPGAKFCGVCGHKDEAGQSASADQGNASDNSADQNLQSALSQDSAGNGNTHDYGSAPAAPDQGSVQKTGSVNAELTQTITDLNNMSILQIVCLIITFIPYINSVSFIILIVILVKSFSLTNKVKTLLDDNKYFNYGSLVGKIRKKCKAIVGYLIFSAIGIPVLVIIGAVLMVSLGISGDSAVVYIFGFLLVLIFCLYSLYVWYAQIYCFVNLYVVKPVLDHIQSGENVPDKFTNAGAIAGGIFACIGIFIMIAVFAIAGLAMASIDSEYSFKDSIENVSAVKTQVANCISVVGAENMAQYCSTGNKSEANEGQNSWDLTNTYQSSTLYIENISVEGGTITVNMSRLLPISGQKLVLIPTVQNGKVVDWSVGKESDELLKDFYENLISEENNK